MKYEELKKKISDIFSDIDGRGGELPELLDEIEKDYRDRDILSSNLEKSETKIKDLQTTNQKLFLSITKGTTDEGASEADDDDLTGIEAVDRFWQKLEGGN